MKLVDRNDPFYRPLWIRAGLVILCIGWGAMELFLFAEPAWALVFGGIGLYLLWQFFLIRDETPEQDRPRDGNDSER